MTKVKRTTDTPASAIEQEEVPQLNEPAATENATLAAAPEPAPQPAPQPEPTPASTPAPAPKSAGFSMKRVFRGVLMFLLRLLIALLVLGALAAAVLIGWPLLYDRYLLPVENHTAQIVLLKAENAQLTAQLNALETQIAVIQADRTNQGGDINELGKRATNLENTQLQIQAAATAQSATLAEMQKKQAELETGNQSMDAELQRQVKLMRGMELLSRARLFLYQSNFGLAQQDILAARDIFTALLPGAPQTLGAQISEVTQRLDLCLSRLPDYPVPASYDLDIAWQILMGMAPPVMPVETPAPTPTP